MPAERVRARNLVVIEGELSKPPEVRTLQSGTELAVLTVRVRSDDEPTRSLAVTVWEPDAVAVGLAAGDEVVAVGHVVRRFYGGVEGRTVRTEIVADAVVAASDRRRRRRMLDRAIEHLRA
jgi:single-stranded DNA-binding protein